ncbi:Serpentine Receptor, class H [Caenorhabditis elegans]|uniref:Serpentine Receptor, class H n=1 Tax=Caenorhabditis elegans TaxID=6239 RepID=H8W3X2_CAEEL|nr:Serpentine Receptor, class H [Caenorhabditis elegans]CCG28269.1 Serpentine Receptor, class H [Caenorhabditis elegans]|eukprot:NP_001256054.1 Serpentine Receptor, class H [Caenorhabditis elegans]
MNCLESSPLIFRIFTHSIHFVSLPTYFLALFSLVSIKSKVFVTYRYFLLWHVLENLFFEMHSDFLVAPAVHPPFCAIRATGILSQIGMSSLVQFYWLSLAIQYTAASVSEMFYFRYKASILNYKTYRFTYFIKLSVYFIRCISVFDTFLAILTSQDAYRFQEEHKATFLKQDPSAHFLTCDNVYLFVPFADYISTTIIILWIVECIVLFLSIPGTAIFINLSISKSASESTWKIQKNLLKSLVIQASIHSIMMGVPNGMFNYAFFFGYENESLAYGAFVILTYHGFVSTFALIIFTKPLREYLLIAFKMKKTATQKVSMTSLHKRTSVF